MWAWHFLKAITRHVFYRLIAFDDHGHAAIVRRIGDIAFNVKAIGAKLVGFVGTIHG